VQYADGVIFMHMELLCVAKDAYRPEEVKGAPVTCVASATSVTPSSSVASIASCMEAEELIDGVINGANKQTRPVRLRFKRQGVPQNKETRDNDVKVETVYLEQTVNRAEFNDLYSRHNPALDPICVAVPGADDDVTL
jgi:hypothetical protein